MESDRTGPTDGQRRVLVALKRLGAASAGEIAQVLDITDVGARQHLLGLEGVGLVQQEAREASGRGRPGVTWSLGDAAGAYFPDSHAELTVGLIRATRRALGAEGLERVIDARAREQAKDYTARMPGATAGLKKRVAALAQIRTGEGYMAEVVTERPGSFLLIEHHCPICDAARQCQGLCAAELDVFRKALGKDVRVERIEHVLSEGRRCVYRVEKAGG